MMPLGAARAPTLVQLMLGDLHRLGRREFYDLTPQSKLRVLQRIAAGGTLLHLVLNGLGGCLSTACTVLVFSSLATRLLLGFVFGFGSGGLDEGRWLAPVFVQLCLQLSNHRQCLGKL